MPGLRTDEKKNRFAIITRVAQFWYSIEEDSIFHQFTK